MLLKENLKMAVKSIRSNKMRTFLTMLGIIIGISSVIMIISTGAGAQQYMMSQFESVGNSTVQFRVNYDEATDNDRFTVEDLQAVAEKVPHVKAVSQEYQYGGTAGIEGKKESAIVMAGSDDFIEFANADILAGRFYSSEDYLAGRKVAVIDENMAKLAFGTTDVLGESLDVYVNQKRVSVRVIGLFGMQSGQFTMPNMPGMVIMPATTFSQGFDVKDRYSYFYVKADDPKYTETIGNTVIALMEARHGAAGRDLYYAENLMKQVEMISSVLGLIQTFVAAVAAISLLVGGIGVMNIMLVAVTERTREIGIRKSLGAKTGTILMQFLTESAILTLLGGIIGLVLGLLGSYGLCTIAGIDPVFSTSTIIMTICFSAAVGIFFGIYPAQKAARLNPIDALRHQ